MATQQSTTDGTQVPLLSQEEEGTYLERLNRKLQSAKEKKPKGKPKSKQKNKLSADTGAIAEAIADRDRCQQHLNTCLVNKGNDAAESDAARVALEALSTAVKALEAAKESAEVDKAASAAAAEGDTSHGSLGRGKEDPGPRRVGRGAVDVAP